MNIWYDVQVYIYIRIYIWSFCAALSSHGWLMGWFITNIWDSNFQAFLVRWGAHGPIPWYPPTFLVLGALKYHVRSHHPQDTYYNLVQPDITWYHLVFFPIFENQCISSFPPFACQSHDQGRPALVGCELSEGAVGHGVSESEAVEPNGMSR